VIGCAVRTLRNLAKSLAEVEQNLISPTSGDPPCSIGWRFLAAYALELAVRLWFNGNRIMKGGVCYGW